MSSSCLLDFFYLVSACAWASGVGGGWIEENFCRNEGVCHEVVED